MGHNSSKPVNLKKSIRKSASNLSSQNANSSSEDEADGDLNLQQKSQKKKGSKKGKMPLFRKQSTNAKKRQDHQQYLAKENPEPIFDLSNCEIEEIPSGVYALCKVLQKEVLLLHDNWLSSIHSACNNITDLSSIRVLDVHNNELRHIPDEIGELKCLQVLNLERNRLTKLPKTIGHLSCVQTLNIQGNKIKELPDSVCQMKSLRMLEIRENRITELPRQLCQVRTLETLNLDAISMKYPNYTICCSGTEAIMKFLCSECDMEYLPPSNFLLNVLEPPKPELLSPQGSRALQQEEHFLKHITGYNDMLNQKRLELIEVERQFAEHQEEQAQLALMAQKNRDQMIAIIAQEESKMERELDKLSKQKEINQKNLIDDLRKVEEGADNLISSLLDMNAKAKKTEELLDAIEEERIKENKLFEVRWEESQNLRKKEVLKNMEMILHHSEWFEGVRKNFASDKENSLQMALENDEMMANAQIESVLLNNDKQMTLLLEDLAKQEQLQRDAFEALLLQKDAKHQRITNQIALIQEELSNLTVVEVERREFRAFEEMNRLAEKRIALIELLSQLMLEQDNRQIELRRRLEEMEQQKEDGQTDYWLVQYQRLMDQKPQSLIDREQNLEISVVKILNKAKAEDYLPRFARHRITIETLVQMTEDDFKQMGIHELGIRKDILRCVEAYKQEQNKLGEMDSMAGKATFVEPSRPPTAPPEDVVFTARQTSIVARGLNSECTICLDSISEVIFMNCGHVCTCLQCCESVKQCPLCRADIVRRVKLMTAQV
ncbi:E3 ubiquitin-protein ligase LRSAM1-like [Ruditapes philippinarum]|uniref:E3 ubiquitin-protein ligase LRSAM1-like n=1 Tax=Ruditapes philippinarum TaxID=129788 RepID=UPI00295AC02B|nr:E3 ubiquitin-protein ligase LRSAM1-like [Ruditapes philippinarum]XP_060571913.1 E3 ubiquitin-protein ligase LRSAM1-like [Ruditapes philippinarum]